METISTHYHVIVITSQQDVNKLLSTVNNTAWCTTAWKTQV